MDAMAGYRKTGVRLVARALGCESLSLVTQDLRGQVRVVTWDRTGEVTHLGWVADGALLRLLAGLPLLRPTRDETGAIVVTVQGPDLGLAGWRLVSAGAFDDADLDATARLAVVLADPAMRETDRAAERPTARREGTAPGPGRPAPSAVITLLTAREAEILSLVGAGLTAKAIARRCGISERTVQKHLEQAYRKLDCHDRVSAVLLARDCGLLSTGRLVTVA